MANVCFGSELDVRNGWKADIKTGVAALSGAGERASVLLATGSEGDHCNRCGDWSERVQICDRQNSLKTAHPVSLRLRSSSSCNLAETWMLSSGIKSFPTQPPFDGFKSVRTVVPTTLEVVFATSRFPRADAQTTLPQSAFPQGPRSMIALPMGFFHRPSIGACGVN